MSLTVADIARISFDGVAGAISGVIHDATLSWNAQTGVYDTTTGQLETTPESDAGRAMLDEQRPKADIFPAYVVGPSDKMVLLEGFGVAPKENMTVSFSGLSLTVMAVADVAGGGGLYYVMAR